MNQKTAWEKEYSKPKLLTLSQEPRNDLKVFVKYIRKTKFPTHNLKILDLGSGTGRNALYLASLDNEVVCVEFSATANKIASTEAKKRGVELQILHQSLSDKLPFANESFDLGLDVMSSTTLIEQEREVYLAETTRVLKKGAWFLVRALCKDGDKNAQNLLKKFPAKERDTYKMPETNFIERVFSESDFRALYGQSFEIVKLERKTKHAPFQSQSYKRNYWVGYLRKR